MNYRVVLVENEAHSRSRLRRLLAAFQDRVEIVGESQDGPAAVSLIRSTTPDVVFLDIDLPGLSGFEVLARLEVQPAVIFMTAFNRQAFEAGHTIPANYLLKPIDEQALQKAFTKLEEEKLDATRHAAALQPFLASTGDRYQVNFVGLTRNRTHVLKTGEVMYFQQSGERAIAHTANNSLPIDTPLDELEKNLDSRDFIRIRRDTLVNISWIAEIRRSFDGRLKVLLKDARATELLASGTFADNLRNL